MEAVAIASSVISVVSLFVELAEKVQGLLDFWVSFQDAPANIKKIAEDLDIFHHILEQGVHTQRTDNTILQKLLERSKDKVKKLEHLMHKFAPKFGSERLIVRKWASFRATLNKRNLEEFQRSLGDTKLDLILISQVIAAQTLNQNHQSLETTILCLESQNSRLVNTIESLESLEAEVRNRFCNPQRELQQTLRKIHMQIHPLASGFINSVMKEMLSTTVTTPVQSPEMREHLKDLDGKSRMNNQKSQSTHDLRLYKLDTESKQINYNDSSGPGRAAPITIKGFLRTSQTSKHVVKHAAGKYATFLGIIKWRTRTVRVNHQASTRDDNERFEAETEITLQPSRWLSARCLSLRLSKFMGSFACSIRHYPVIPPESLIFEYCQNGNLLGLRDLLEHGFGSKKPEESVLATFRALVEHGGADLSAVDAQGANILAEVGWSNQECLGIAWLLNQEDMDIDFKKPNFGRTAIMTLVYGSGDYGSELLKILINRGVDIQAQKDTDVDDDESGYTALHFAVRNICEDPSQRCGSSLLGLLLEKGADAHVSDSKGKTPTAIALTTSHAFNAWRQAVCGHQNLNAFIKEELKQSQYLWDEGWREESLLKVFECSFDPVLPAKLAIPPMMYYEYHQTFWETDMWEPWWLELQNLIKGGMKPIAPLPAQWRRRITPKEEPPEFLNIRTGILTQKRPEGVFFSNLKTPDAQKMYREGSIKIEQEKPVNFVNRNHEGKVDCSNAKGCIANFRDRTGANEDDKGSQDEDSWEHVEKAKPRLEEVESDGEDIFEDFLDNEPF
ncbi:MAG: hypothetical protein Q9187_002640 [Circinaria calcarea]